LAIIGLPLVAREPGNERVGMFAMEHDPKLMTDDLAPRNVPERVRLAAVVAAIFFLNGPR